MSIICCNFGLWNGILFLRCRDVEELGDAVAEAHGGGGFDD